jgi:hypothetical protein
MAKPRPKQASFDDDNFLKDMFSGFGEELASKPAPVRASGAKPRLAVSSNASQFRAAAASAPAPATPATGLRLKQQTLSPRDLAINSPQSSGVFEGKQLVDLTA